LQISSAGHNNETDNKSIDPLIDKHRSKLLRSEQCQLEKRFQKQDIYLQERNARNETLIENDGKLCIGEKRRSKKTVARSARTISDFSENHQHSVERKNN
jgi:hypothetical protein